jgi:hypothetical protein
LETDLPRVTLLKGVESTGRWLLAEYILQYHGIKDLDILKLPILTLDSIEDLTYFVSTAPWESPFKAVLTELDGSKYPEDGQAPPVALSALVTALESPSPKVKFMLLSSGPGLEEVESRADVVNLGLLRTGTVKRVLTSNLKIAPRLATIAANQSGGTIIGAKVAINAEYSKNKVISVLKAISENDYDLVLEATQGNTPKGNPVWGIAEQNLLNKWISEAISEQWEVFSATDSYSLHKNKKLLVSLLVMMSKIPKTRPSLALRVAFDSLSSKK